MTWTKTLFGFLQRLQERHFLNDFLDCWWSSLVSLCNSNLWLAVTPSNLTDTDVIVVSSEDSRKTCLCIFFIRFDQECPSGRVFTREWQLYLLHAFTPISGSGLKPTILFEYHGSCLLSSRLNSSLVTNVLFVQLEDVEGVLMRIELDPPPCILGIFCLNFHWILSVRSFKSLPFFS